MPKLVIASHACVLAINRAVYYRLANFGWDIHLVVPAEWRDGQNSKYPEPATSDAVRLHTLPLVGRSPRSYFFRGLEKLCSSLDADVVMLDVDPVSIQASRYYSWARYSSGKIVCLSCENLPFDLGSTFKRKGVRGLPASIAKLFLASVTRRFVSHVFTINDDGNRLFKKLGYASVSKIPLGFDPTFFRVDECVRQATRSELGLTHITFGYFGRLVPEKGVHVLLEALAGMTAWSWHLILDRFDGHESAYTATLQQLITRHGLSTRIKHFDAPHGTIARYMNAADVVVLPSLSSPGWKEQYGRVIPEAMACGCAPVVTGSGALPELVGTSGMVVNEGDARSLQRALIELLEDASLRFRMRQCAVSRASELSIDAQALLMNAQLSAISASQERQS